MRKTRAAFAFILVNVLLDGLSLGLIFPVLPNLIVELSAGNTAFGSRAFGYIAAGWALANFLAAPVLGTLSDRFGRRPVLLISTFGLAIDFVIMALAPSLIWLFIGRLLSGLSAATLATASAYLADVTPEEGRAGRFGLLYAIYGIGMILGPAAGGLLGQYDLRAPFWAAAGLAALGGLYGLLVLPESLPREGRNPINWISAMPVKSFGILSRHKLLGLASVFTLTQIGVQASNAIFVLYIGYRYHWSVGEIGLMLMAYSAGSIIVMAVIAPLVVKMTGERRALLVGLAFSGSGLLGLALAPNSIWVCAAAVLSCMGGIIGPAIQALLSSHVVSQEQGRLQGALGALTAVASATGPILFTQIFAWSITGHRNVAWSGLALGFGAFLFVVAGIMSHRFARQHTAATPLA